MAHNHKFELTYKNGTKEVRADIDMVNGNMTATNFPWELTASQFSILNKFFSLLIELHREFDDYQTLECNEE